MKELLRYREYGLRKVDQLIPFECDRFKRELKVKRMAKLKLIHGKSIPQPASRFLPAYGDYSLKAILDPDHEEKAAAAPGGPFGGPGKRKKTKKSKWSRKKEKTGRRLLLQQGCILTLASPARRESTDSTS